MNTILLKLLLKRNGYKHVLFGNCQNDGKIPELDDSIYVERLASIWFVCYGERGVLTKVIAFNNTSNFTDAIKNKRI